MQLVGNAPGFTQSSRFRQARGEQHPTVPPRPIGQHRDPGNTRGAVVVPANNASCPAAFGGTIQLPNDALLVADGDS